MTSESEFKSELPEGHWQKVKDAFCAVLETEPERRQAYLLEICSGDDWLLSEVKSLLNASDGQDDILDRPIEKTVAEIFGTESDPARLNLTSGTLVGPYKIINKIGQGGMAEIYLTQDTRLVRNVALKFLPVQFTKDHRRVSRFLREARAASQLNHPNIVTVYDIGQHDETYFIVTEFVEGRTLRDYIEALPAPVDESEALTVLSSLLNIACQICDALHAAHQSGIVHRDIKPENIMLQSDNHVKVLDFGLAKLIDDNEIISGSNARPTTRDTSGGLIIGTAAYMSPEQARGLEVDVRTDIFSLGVTIYEMIAGRLPFHGESNLDAIARMLHHPAAPLTLRQYNAPEGLQRVIEKALRKEPEDRYQTIAELRSDLKALKIGLGRNQEQEESSQASKLPNTNDARTTLPMKWGRTGVHIAPTSEAAFAGKTIGRRGLLTGIAAGLALLLIVVFGVNRGLRGGVKHRIDLNRIQIKKLTSSGNAMVGGVSPDGKFIAYRSTESDGKTTVWLQETDTNRRLAVFQSSEVSPFDVKYSPDGRYLYFLADEKLTPRKFALYQIATLNGVARKLAVDFYTYFTVSPEGNQIGLVREPPDGKTREIAIVDIANQTEKVIFQSSAVLSDPAWSPDGGTIALVSSEIDSAKQEYNRILLVDVVTRQSRIWQPLKMRSIREMTWAPDQNGLFIIASDGGQMRQIWYVSYPDGVLERVTSDLSYYNDVHLTADGQSLIASQTSETANIWLIPTASPETARPLTNVAASFYDVTWSPDGRLIATGNLTGKHQIWEVTPDDGESKQITFDDNNKQGPVICGEGKYIVFASSRNGRFNIWRTDRDGTNLRQLTDVAIALNPECSSDGKSVFFTLGQEGVWSIWRIPFEGGRPEQVIARGSSPLVSPDGHNLAYSVLDSTTRTFKVYIKDMDEYGITKIFDLPPEYTGTLSWRTDGQGFTFSSGGPASQIYYQPLSGGRPQKLTMFDSQKIYSAAWSPDGKYLAVIRGQRASDVIRISNY